jgi:hypothetical protein
MSYFYHSRNFLRCGVPLILAAFEIQPLMMRLNRLRLKIAEKRKLKQTMTHPENDGMPDFMKLS